MKFLITLTSLFAGKIKDNTTVNIQSYLNLICTSTETHLNNFIENFHSLYKSFNPIYMSENKCLKSNIEYEKIYKEFLSKEISQNLNQNEMKIYFVNNNAEEILKDRIKTILKILKLGEKNLLYNNFKNMIIKEISKKEILIKEENSNEKSIYYNIKKIFEDPNVKLLKEDSKSKIIYIDINKEIENVFNILNNEKNSQNSELPSFILKNSIIRIFLNLINDTIISLQSEKDDERNINYKDRIVNKIITYFCHFYRNFDDLYPRIEKLKNYKNCINFYFIFDKSYVGYIIVEKMQYISKIIDFIIISENIENNQDLSKKFEEKFLFNVQSNRYRNNSKFNTKLKQILYNSGNKKIFSEINGLIYKFLEDDQISVL